MELEFFSNTHHKLSDNSTKVTVSSSSYYQNVFGNVLIRSTSKESHCWQFKILKNRESYGIDIGIVEHNHLDSEPSFTSNGHGYGLCSNGNIYSAAHCTDKQNYKLKNCKQRYTNNDLVLMTLDLQTQTLSFIIESENKHKSHKKITIKNIKKSENICYKMAVYLSYKKDSVKLVEHIKQVPQTILPKQTPKAKVQCSKHCFKIISELKVDNDKLKKKLKSVSVNNSDTDTEYKQNCEEYKSQIKTLQNELSIKTDEIEDLQYMIRQKDLQLIALQNKLKNMDSANRHRAMNRTVSDGFVLRESKARKEKVRVCKEKTMETMESMECESSDSANDKKSQVIKADDSWLINLNSKTRGNDKKRRGSIMALKENKAVSRRLSNSAINKLILT